MVIDSTVGVLYTQRNTWRPVRRSRVQMFPWVPDGEVFFMTIASTRAQSVAEILWELKRAEKLATLTAIAERAGFSPGAGGRTISTYIKTVRRDWPHLQWWRAVSDDGVLDQEQGAHLVEAGFEVEAAEDDHVVIKSLEDQLMNWAEPDDAEADAESEAAESA